MNPLDHYSPNYQTARRRFSQAALNARAHMEHHLIDAPDADINTQDAPSQEDDALAIDVAILGDPVAEKTLIVSSGLHGIEGFFGSAIQLAWLAEAAAQKDLLQNKRVVFIHAINPYGFSCRRRANEDNIDLNRNFLTEDQTYQGSPKAYAQLDKLLNPTTPPTKLECFRLRAFWNIQRHGLKTIKQAVAGGQYEYPKGLFYGGSAPARSTQIIKDNIAQWIADAQDIIHIDLHSGLGQFGQYKILLTEADAPNGAWYRKHFGAKQVEQTTGSTAKEESTAYPTTGAMGRWIGLQFQDRNYRFALAEFGTFSVISVLGALRAENRAHFYCDPNAPHHSAYQEAKTQLCQCFCPASGPWRSAVVTRGLELIKNALLSLSP